MTSEITKEELIELQSKLDEAYQPRHFVFKIMNGEISVENAVVEMLKQRMKPLVDEAIKEEKELERLFVEGTGSFFPFGKIYLPKSFVPRSTRKSKPIKMSPLEWLRRNV